MPAPVKTIMDDLEFIASCLRGEGRYGEAISVGILEEAANCAGHHVYTWDGVAKAVRDALPAIQGSSEPLGEDTLELLDAVLSKPKEQH